MTIMHFIKKYSFLSVIVVLVVGLGAGIGFIVMGHQANGNHITAQMKKAFIATAVKKYPGWFVGDIQADEMCDGSRAYNVDLSNNGSRLSMILDQHGAYIQSEFDTAFKDVAPALFAVLKNKYSSYSYGDTYEAVTRANGEKQYMFDLIDKSSQQTSELILSPSGKELCLQS